MLSVVRKIARATFGTISMLALPSSAGCNLQVSAGPGGSVSADSDGCTPDCNIGISAGRLMTRLDAFPDTGYEFHFWEGWAFCETEVCFIDVPTQLLGQNYSAPIIARFRMIEPIETAAGQFKINTNGLNYVSGGRC